jgi:hypothetical protein
LCRNSYLGGEKASGPITYAVDGKQYVVGTGGGVMYATLIPLAYLLRGDKGRVYASRVYASGFMRQTGLGLWRRALLRVEGELALPSICDNLFAGPSLL